MWLSDRRSFLLGALALGGCGFVPAYGPEGPARVLLNSVRIDDPDTQDKYQVTRRFEERMGVASPSAPYALALDIDVDEESLGESSTGSLTRFQLLGSLTYKLRRSGEKAVLQTGTVRNFTGYSATGSTAATLSAKRDARERLMTILADQLIERLVLASPDLPEA